jgi:hypothetical protein
VSTSGVVPTTTLADPPHKRQHRQARASYETPTSATAPPIPATIDRRTPANAQGPTDRSHPRDPTLLAASVHESTRFCVRLAASVSGPPSRPPLRTTSQKLHPHPSRVSQSHERDASRLRHRPPVRARPRVLFRSRLPRLPQIAHRRQCRASTRATRPARVARDGQAAGPPVCLCQRRRAARRRAGCPGGAGPPAARGACRARRRRPNACAPCTPSRQGPRTGTGSWPVSSRSAAFRNRSRWSSSWQMKMT